MIDELAHAGPEHLDAAFVAGFDRKQGYPDPAEDLDAFEAQGLDAELHGGGPRHGHRAVRARGRPAVRARDGGGRLAGHARLLRERAAAAGLANLDCVRAGFLSYQHAGPPADGVYTRHALHQLPDFWKALALDRIARMLRPGGVLRLRDLIYDFRPAEPGGLPGLVRPRGGRSRRRLYQRGLRRTHPHRVQHLPLAARADARRGRFRDRRRRLRAPSLRRLHLRQRR